MKFAFCNEMFGDRPFAQAWLFARDLGYTGVEIAPFTLMPGKEVVDANDISSARRTEVRQLAADLGLEVVGLHWLLAKTTGLCPVSPYLTSPEPSVRQVTVDYFIALAQLCADLGGKVMVLGSPQQRNLLPDVTYDLAENYAAEILRAVMPVCEDMDVTIALEPLGPSEGDFLLTAESAIKLAKRVDSPNCKLHLDVKAMSSEDKPIDQIIRESRKWTAHFHANDPNLLGPGMGDVEFESIFAALKETNYDGWASVEVFKYEPSPEEIASQSISYMRRVWETL
ncbi:MAG: sugar phosphate isomerase/epimerase family protein [Planctomycetota bacterium]